MSPVSDKGNQYMLTTVDYATRYTEAIPLAKSKTEHVTKALLDVFCRFGFPKEVLSNRGSQFASDLMCEVCQLFTLRQLYNHKCNGLCERVLKGMVKKMCQE